MISNMLLGTSRPKVMIQILWSSKSQHSTFQGWKGLQLWKKNGWYKIYSPFLTYCSDYLLETDWQNVQIICYSHTGKMFRLFVRDRLAKSSDYLLQTDWQNVQIICYKGTGKMFRLFVRDGLAKCHKVWSPKWILLTETGCMIAI